MVLPLPLSGPPQERLLLEASGLATNKTTSGFIDRSRGAKRFREAQYVAAATTMECLNLCLNAIIGTFAGVAIVLTLSLSSVKHQHRNQHLELSYNYCHGSFLLKDYQPRLANLLVLLSHLSSAESGKWLELY